MTCQLILLSLLYLYRPELADTSGAFLLIYMDIIFGAEVADGAHDRVGRRRAQLAQRGIDQGGAEFFEEPDVFRLAPAFGDAG
jgi:hypothetical protein